MAKNNSKTLLILALAAGAGIYFLTKNSVPNVRVENLNWLTGMATIVYKDVNLYPIRQDQVVNLENGYSVYMQNGAISLWRNNAIVQILARS